jgi:chromosomal replication initiator protein
MLHRILVADVQRAVAARFGLTQEELTGRCHCRAHSHPRQLAMYLSKQLTGQSNLAISRRFDRDPTTTTFARRQVTRRRADDPALDAIIVEITAQLSQPSMSKEGVCG